MKLYFGVITQYHWRNARSVGKTGCVVSASSEDEARDKLWQRYGGENSVLNSVLEINPEDGYSYTVYKSEM